MWFVSSKGFHDGSKGKYDGEFHKSLCGEMYSANWRDFKGPYHSYGMVLDILMDNDEIISVFFHYKRKYLSEVVQLLYENMDALHWKCVIEMSVEGYGSSGLHIDVFIDGKKLVGSGKTVPQGYFSTYCNAIKSSILP